MVGELSFPESVPLNEEGMGELREASQKSMKFRSIVSFVVVVTLAVSCGCTFAIKSTGSSQPDALKEEAVVRQWWEVGDRSIIRLLEETADDSEATAWWNKNASDQMMHLDPAYVAKLEQGWSAFLPHFNWTGKAVVDYGCGGGFLGLKLFETYGISQYTGIDIAQKSLDQTRTRLAKWVADDTVQLKRTPVEFSDVNSDIFVSQQVIQHFPSVDYLEHFLENVDSSQAKQLMLHFRQSNNGETYSTDAYRNGAASKRQDVVFALLANVSFFTSHLKNYALMWQESSPMANGTKGTYLGFQLKA